MSLLLALFSLSAAQSPAPAPAPAPVAQTTTASGLFVSADLRDTYLSGAPLLVQITLQNQGAQTLTVPDLNARPYLVHFIFSNKGVRTDRFNTPPAVESTASWVLKPKDQRQVWLEVPAGTGLAAGTWTFGLEIRDPAGTISIPSRTMQIMEPRPVAGHFFWEPLLSTTTGTALTWLHQSNSGFDLYLMTFDPKHPGRGNGQYFLQHLSEKVDPQLSRARPEDASARYVYWRTGAQTISVLRLDGMAARGAIRNYALPYPSMSFLGEGVTDGRGGLQVPVWIPSPKGTGGEMKVVGIDTRGEMTVREVGALAAPPSQVATGLDAGGNLLLAVGHADAVDVYRVDPTWAKEIPARGLRAMKLDSGWRAGALSWDVLPDSPERPGGLSLQMLLLADNPKTYRQVRTDLAGKVISDSTVLPWAAPGTLLSQLSAGTGHFYTLSKDGNTLWYMVQGQAPVKLSITEAGVLWQDVDGIRLRRVAGSQVVQDQLLGPIVK